MGRRKVLIGALVLIAAVALVVVLTRDGDPELERVASDYSTFPTRGSLADDDELVRTAVEAWQDEEDGTPPRTDLKVQLLYAGEVDGDRIVMLAQPGRQAAVREVDDDVWRVTTRRHGWDPFDPEPLVLGRTTLLPRGEWRQLPVSTNGERLENHDGLLYGELDRSLIIQTDPPEERSLAVLFDTERGSMNIDAQSQRRILDAAGDVRAIRAVHGAVNGAEIAPEQGDLILDTVWLGDVGDAKAAVAAFHFPEVSGIGAADDPDGGATDVISADLGARDGEGTGAAWIDDALVATAGGKVERLEIRSGKRRIVRDGPVAVLDGLPREGTVVTGLDADGAVVGSLTPRLR